MCKSENITQGSFTFFGSIFEPPHFFNSSTAELKRAHIDKIEFL